MEPEPPLVTSQSWDAILLGAGSGIRFAIRTGRSGTDTPKQFCILGDKPVFIHSLLSLLKMNCFRQIVLAVPSDFMTLAQRQIRQFVPTLEFSTKIRVIAGGKTRQESSALAIASLEDAAPARILIHDACRPLLARDFRERIQKYLSDRSYAVWVPVVPVVDTLKEIENQEVKSTLDRNIVQRVQTPQIFEYAAIRSLVERAKENPEINFTDDASLCEYYGIPVGVFEGDVRNIKLTYEFEFELLKLMLSGLKLEEESQSCAPESVMTSTVSSPR